MQQTRQRNTKKIRRAQEEQYGEANQDYIKPKTIPQGKLTTVASDYRIQQGVQEDFDRTLFRQQNPSGKKIFNNFFSDHRRSRDQWKQQKADSTTDSDTQETRKYTQYGTFPRSNRKQGRLESFWRNTNPQPPQTYETYRKTYKFILTTDEPTTLTGDHTHKIYAIIPEGTKVTADSHQRGPSGETIYQTNKATQTSYPYLSSFEGRFKDMSL
jgi:hypothetical protein